MKSEFLRAFGYIFINEAILHFCQLGNATMSLKDISKSWPVDGILSSQGLEIRIVELFDISYAI